jgi:hypothetical protein
MFFRDSCDKDDGKRLYVSTEIDMKRSPMSSTISAAILIMKNRLENRERVKSK